MVAPLGPGKFYGSSLPRPRIYTDVKYSDERIDPPISVVDPLMSWANEAHWSMGGLCTKRLRLQGRIEGNISKLRAQNEKLIRMKEEPVRSASPPPAPVAGKRKQRLMALVEEEEEEEEVRVVEKEVMEKKKKPARKLINEFNSVATSPIRKSPRSVGGEKSVRSIGGSFASKMRKASENLMRERGSGANDVSEAGTGSGGKLRVSPRLLNKKM